MSRNRAVSCSLSLFTVLSPPSLHAQITVKALGIGKHVVVEAPAGINQNETLRKVKAALYYPSLISSGLDTNKIFLKLLSLGKKVMDLPRESLNPPSNAEGSLPSLISISPSAFRITEKHGTAPWKQYQDFFV